MICNKAFGRHLHAAEKKLMPSWVHGSLQCRRMRKRSLSNRCATTPPSSRSSTGTRIPGSRSGASTPKTYPGGCGGSAPGGARAPFARRLNRTKQPLIEPHDCRRARRRRIARARARTKVVRLSAALRSAARPAAPLLSSEVRRKAFTFTLLHSCGAHLSLIHI